MLSGNQHKLDSPPSGSNYKLRICSIWTTPHGDLSLSLPPKLPSFYYKQVASKSYYKVCEQYKSILFILHLRLYSAEYIADHEIDL